MAKVDDPMVKLSIDMTNDVAITLIAQLVKRGFLDADDVAEMCEALPEALEHRILAAWATGSVPNAGKDYAPPKPTLKIVPSDLSNRILETMTSVAVEVVKSDARRKGR